MGLMLSIPVVCGQLIVGGFEDESLPASFAGALSAGKRGGAILFKRNLPTVEHARALCADIIDASRPQLPPFIGVDEEGGRVSRLPPPVLRLPPMARLARTGDLRLLNAAGSLLGRQLAACGFNLDFAPVLDMDTNPANPVIGDRAFGSEPEAASMRALSFYQGLSEHVLGCGKHFPGHGDTHVDSHHGLPVVEHDRKRLGELELVPFMAAARSNMDSFMTAHLIVTALDPDVPATLSRKVCTDLLRRDMGFDGVLFSDDLEMRAVADRYPVEESAVMAIEAGCDVLLICKREDWQDRAHEALVRRAERDTVFRERCHDAAMRGLTARRRRVAAPLGDATRFSRLMGESRAMEQRIREACGA
jgi:beta-N-acetylhexosaminidase